MNKSEKKISKRNFLKYGLYGTCGMIAGLSNLDLIAGEISKMASGLPSVSPDKLWKWSKEALYYIETPKGIKCRLCPHACFLKEGETGDCRTRIALENKLYTIVYGNPCAIHVDPIEKKPLYHFLPESRAFSVATAGCNLACLNCQNWQISQSSPKETTNYDLMPDKLVEKAKSYKCKSIAYTYSEPIVFYEYMYDSAKIAHANNIKNIFVSAGYIKEKPLRNLSKYIDAANIDLKSFSNDIYEMLNGGTLQPVLNTLKILKEENVWLEITNLIVPSWTDNMDMIKKMCDWLYDNGFADCPLHFSRFSPTYKLTQLPYTSATTLKKARKIAIDAGLKYVYIGNIVGSKAENTYCPNCGEVLIERKGFRIIKNSIKNNKCSFCGEKIAGVWE
ncbi:MAG: AmmeMemoRadiSam system radical SAM enzyme [Bacteroidales bacterium]|nr:AmmeMemoRadiSam system radical SAM enzyme [Bacteroidales bacterium]